MANVNSARLARSPFRRESTVVKALRVTHATLDTPYQGGFVGRTHHFALRVYYEDTDAAGIVYYANYLRFMERARTDMLRAVGIEQRPAMENGEGVYVVAEAHIRYCASARLDDALLVLSEVQAARAATAIIHQRVMRDGEKLADAMITAAFLDPDGRPRRQPRAWLDIFKKLEGKGV